MFVGYMRVSSDSDRQSTDLQRDALLAVGIDARHLFGEHKKVGGIVKARLSNLEGSTPLYFFMLSEGW